MSVLEKASQAIDCLGHADKPVRLGHVSSALGLPKSSAHRLLSELSDLGIVRRTEDGRYSLGHRLLYWGAAAAHSFDLRGLAEPSMRSLRDELGESVHLYVREDDARICIAAVEGNYSLRPFVALGRPLPLTSGAAGKLLLAFAEEDEVDNILEAAGGPVASDALSLARSLESIREQRWATSAGEREEGVSAVATAIVDSVGRVVAALSISGPSTRLTSDRLEELRAPLMACALRVSTLVQSGK